MPGSLTELSRVAARIVAGTAVYIVIVVLAAAKPSAAGLMLTFPTLNGLAFLFSRDEDAAAIARTMLWMPVINGVLCAAYIVFFLMLANSMPPAPLGWGLLGLVIALWFVAVSRKPVRAGVDARHQFAFAIAATLVGAACAGATLIVLDRAGLAPGAAAPSFHPQNSAWMASVIAGSELKIAMFALTLAIFTLAIHYSRISDSTRGILAGLPIVPFGGLVSVGGDPTLSLDSIRNTFFGMAGGVWLGAPVAIWFIYLFARFLGARHKLKGQAADSALRVAVLVASWLAAFVVIVAIAGVLGA